MEKEAKQRGDIYQIANNQTLGITEKRNCKKLKPNIAKNNRTRKNS